MDAYEATKTVMSRIQALDPDNSSKIMGSILIQDQGDKEMIRLAFSPDPILLSYINRAKAGLGLSSNNGGGGLVRPCMYGFCNNGGGAHPIDEMLRMKPLQQQWIADMGCYRSKLKLDRGLTATANSVAHQIYLTFPAESTFKEEDVTDYFGMFGPVQDVRIPYQQKRMFGFVTFVYPETVKLILAKGNPHFVCDSRVLVKPYKDKGKFKEKKHYAQQCLSPSGVDAEHLDTPIGPRMLLSPRDMMLRRKLEQEAEMQHAIELESRRMMSLQLMDPDNENHNYRYLNGLPSDILYSSPGNSEILMNRHLTSSSDSINQENSEEFDGGQDPSVPADEKKFPEPEATEFSANNNMGVGNKLHRGNSDDSDVHESLLEHNLPNNLFTSPTKSAAENHCGFSESNTDSAQITTSSSSNDPHLPGTSPGQHSFSETILPSHAKFYVMAELEKMHEVYEKKVSRIEELKAKKESMLVEVEKQKHDNPEKMRELKELSENYNNKRDYLFALLIGKSTGN